MTNRTAVRLVSAAALAMLGACSAASTPTTTGVPALGTMPVPDGVVQLRGVPGENLGDALWSCDRENDPDWVLSTAPAWDRSAPAHLYRVDDVTLAGHDNTDNADQPLFDGPSVRHQTDTPQSMEDNLAVTVQNGDDCGIVSFERWGTFRHERFTEAPSEPVRMWSALPPIGDCGDLDGDGLDETCMQYRLVPGPFDQAGGSQIDLRTRIARTPDLLLGRARAWGGGSQEGFLNVWALPIDLDDPVPTRSIPTGLRHAIGPERLCTGLKDEEGRDLVFVAASSAEAYRGRGVFLDLDRLLDAPEGMRLTEMGRPAEGWLYDSVFGQDCATGDFDGDGQIDLAVSAPGDSRILFFAGPIARIAPDTVGQRIDPDWDIQALHVDLESIYGWSLAAADLDHDGIDELLVGAPDADDGAGLIDVWQGPVTPQ